MTDPQTTAEIIVEDRYGALAWVNGEIMYLTKEKRIIFPDPKMEPNLKESHVYE